MSVTFSIEGIREEAGYELPCPDCGLSLDNAHLHDDRDFDCSCMGYGGPRELPQPRFELNVHNGNAVAILGHLGLDAMAGDVDPRDVLSVLTQRPLEREHHNTVLMRIARQAVKYDRQILWG